MSGAQHTFIGSERLVKMTINERTWPRRSGTQYIVTRPAADRAPATLRNLLADTSAPVLIALAEKYGLPRVPGLDQRALLERLLRNLSAAELEDLLDDLVAARFGSLTIDQLLDRLLELDARRSELQSGHAGRARMDQISADEATLLEGGGRRWAYTMRGHDATIDLARREVSCDCQFFAFASHRGAICKHIATAFKLLPEVYAHKALVDILVSREYGTPATPEWSFESKTT